MGTFLQVVDAFTWLLQLHFLSVRNPLPANTSDNMSDERTFIMIKPDGVQRGLVGEIIKRFEQKGFQLVAMKFMQADEELLKKHYADLSSKPFFPGLIKYMGSGPVVPYSGREPVSSRPAVSCLVRPTPRTLSQAPSVETTVSRLDVTSVTDLTLWNRLRRRLLFGSSPKS